MRPKKNNKKEQIICLCMSVPKSTVEEAIRNGAGSLGEIFDQTSAGVGPCGGSCRPDLKKLLDHYDQTGEFPEIVGSQKDRKQSRRKK